MVTTQAAGRTIVRVPERVTTGRPRDRTAHAARPALRRARQRRPRSRQRAEVHRARHTGREGRGADRRFARHLLPAGSPAGRIRGLYTIRRDDRIAPDAAVTATIRANGRYSTATLGQPLLAGGNGQGINPAGNQPRVARYCTNCATVESVNVDAGHRRRQLSGDRRGRRRGRPAGQPGRQRRRTHGGHRRGRGRRRDRGPRDRTQFQCAPALSKLSCATRTAPRRRSRTTTIRASAWATA
jgi:hypothetical protein